jgi:PAS domain S-box-containing protein
MKKKRGQSEGKKHSLRKRAEELLAGKSENLDAEAIEHRRVQEALIESEERYKNLFENIPVGIYRTTPDGRILMANPALVRMLGCFSFDELASHNLENSEGFGPTYPRGQFRELIEREGEVRGLESAWMRRDKSVIFVRENARASRGEDGTVLYYEGTVEDITERRRAEERFHLAVESAPNAIVMVNHGGRIILINSQTERLFGYKREELIGQSVEILVPERFRTRHSQYRTGFYADPQTRPMGAGRDLFAIRKDGSEFPVEIGLNPIRTEEGVVVLGVIVDITERKRMESKLQQMSKVFMDSADPIIIEDLEGKIVSINPEAEQTYSWRREELVGHSIKTIIPPERYEQTDKLIEQCKKGEEIRNVETLRWNKSGEIRIILNTLSLLTNETGEPVGIASIAKDITERKRAEEALRESEEKLQAIINNTTDAILVYDEQGRVITINREAERLFCGNGKRELKSIWGIIPPEDKVNFSDKLKSVKEGRKLLDYETERLIENRERISVSVSLVYVDEGRGRFIETIRDIRERIILRNKIVELEKAQVVGKMAEGFAHHMGTPLASMLLRVQMLKEDFSGIPEYSNFVEKLDSIERQIFYGQKVIQRLLRFVSKPKNEKFPERISALFEESVEIISPLLRRHGINPELCVDEDLKVLADGNLLELVFSDLMMNAVDAMPRGGKLSIIASKGNPKEQVEIKISDTGMGIPREVLPLVFEPFFTTKPAGKGTGLGLSVAKRIIHDHGGEIGINSVEGKGTSVWIRLPIYTEERTFA